MVYKFSDKKSSTANTLDSDIKNDKMSNQELAEKYHKPFVWKTKSTLTFYK